jgi:hypothetical protein
MMNVVIENINMLKVVMPDVIVLCVVRGANFWRMNITENIFFAALNELFPEKNLNNFRKK